VIVCLVIGWTFQTSKILRLRSVIMQAFRDHYFSRGYVEVWRLWFQISAINVKISTYQTRHFAAKQRRFESGGLCCVGAL